MESMFVFKLGQVDVVQEWDVSSPFFFLFFSFRLFPTWLNLGFHYDFYQSFEVKVCIFIRICFDFFLVLQGLLYTPCTYQFGCPFAFRAASILRGTLHIPVIRWQTFCTFVLMGFSNCTTSKRGWENCGKKDGHSQQPHSGSLLILRGPKCAKGTSRAPWHHQEGGRDPC